MTSVEAAALTWLARLPLLGDEELAQLLEVPAHRGPEIRLSLERLGWIEWIVPGSHAIAQRRLSFVRADVRRDLATALGTDPDAVAQHVPVREQDVYDRIGRLITTACVNRFVAGLAGSPDLAGAHVADARSLPLSLHRDQRWWPTGASAYVCLSAGRACAPFFVAWDRAAAPDSHRRRQVAAWRRGQATTAEHWSPLGVPPVLIVAADVRALGIWSDALEAALEAGEVTALDFGLTTAWQVAQHGPATSIWCHLGSQRPVALVEVVGWGPPPDLWTPVVATLPVLGETRARAHPVRERAPAIAVDQDVSVGARVAAVVTATDAEQKELLQWIARHPLLSASDLAELLGASPRSVEQRLDWLVRCGTCSPVRGESDASLIDPETKARYVLSEFGMRVLAVDAGVGPALFARDGWITFEGDNEQQASTRALRHCEHTLGLNAFMTQLAGDAERVGGRLLEWRNEAESTQRFTVDGRASWIRPDASGLLLLDGTERAFIVEYDRGTLDAGDYRPKLEAYSRYYTARAWEGQFENAPRLLFVCSDSRAEERIGRAAGIHAGDLEVLTTAEWRHTRGADPLGLLAPIWLDPRDRGTAVARTVPFGAPASHVASRSRREADGATR